MNRYSIIAVFLLLIHGSPDELFAQSPRIDSLKARTAAITDDSLLMEHLFTIAYALNDQDPRQALDYGRRSLALARELGYEQTHGELLNTLAISHYYLSHSDSADLYFQRSRQAWENKGNLQKANMVQVNRAGILVSLGRHEEARRLLREAIDRDTVIRDTLNLATAYFNLGYAFDDEGDLLTGTQYYIRAAELYRQIGDQRGELRIYNNLTALHVDAKEPERALEFGRRGIRIAEDIEAFLVLAKLLQNTGLAFDMLERNDSALVYHQRALTYDRQMQDGCREGQDLHNIGVVQSKSDPAAGRQYFLQALDLKKKHCDIYERITTLIELAKIELELDRPAPAGSYLEQLEAIPPEEWVAVEQRDYQDLRAQYLERTGRHREALLAFRQFKTLSDSLTSADKLRDITALEVRFHNSILQDSVQDQQQLVQLMQQRQQLTRTRMQLQWGLLLILSLVAFLLYGFLRTTRRQKAAIQRAKEEIEQQNQQVQLLNRELNHRVKNNLQTVASLLNLQKRRLADESARDALRDGENRLHAFSLAQQRLFEQDAGTAIDLAAYLTDLKNHLHYSYRTVQPNLTIDFSCAPCVIDAEQAAKIGLIVNELTTNSLKHAFAQQPYPRIDIALQLDARGRLSLHYEDNGQGLVLTPKKSAAAPNPTSLGMTLVSDLTRQLSGKMKNQAYTYDFVFDVPNPISPEQTQN